MSGTIMTSTTMSTATNKAHPWTLGWLEKGSRWDPTLFDTYKDEKQWDAWQCSSISQAHAQDVGDILDLAFKPANDQKEDLFKEKQIYMYAVFENMV